MAKEQQAYMQYTPMAWQPGIYQPQAFTPQVADMNLLQHSLNRIEERHNNAVQQNAALHSQLGQLKEKLHRDPNTDKWFDEISTDVDNQIQDAIKFGDFGTAYKTATRLAGEVISRPDVVGRLKWNQDFEAEKKTLDDRLAKKEIDQDTYEWALKKYEDKAGTYANVTDNNGKIIGGSTYTAPRVYDSVDWESLMMFGFKVNNPDYTSTSNETGASLDENGAVVNKGAVKGKTAYAHSKSGYGHTIKQVTDKDIKNAVETIMTNGGDKAMQLQQDFEVAKYRHDRLQAEYDALDPNDPNVANERRIKAEQLEKDKANFYHNGYPDLNAYVAYKIKSDANIAKFLAYKEETTSTSSDLTLPSSGSDSGSGAGTQPKVELTYPNGLPEVKSAPVSTKGKETIPGPVSATRAGQKAGSLVSGVVNNEEEDTEIATAQISE